MMTRAENSKKVLAQLRREAAAAHVRLHTLLESVAAAEARLAGDPSAVLVEVNAELVEAALRAQQQAGTDELTRLPNRVLFTDRVEHAMSLARRDGSRLALLFIDIDGLKRVNDDHGHAAGDLLLRHAAQALLASVRESDSVCRFGGDEFLVLLPAVGDDRDVGVVVEKLQAALAVPWRLGDVVHAASASVGVSVFPGDGNSAGELIAQADAAMYQAKRRHPGGVQFYRPQVQTARPPGAAQRAPAPHGSADEASVLMRDTNERLLLHALQQTDFMAMLAHEFRNPLSSISNAAALLKHPRVDLAMLERIGSLLARQVTHLSRLSHDLLTVGTGGTDRFRLELQRVDLLPLIEAAVEACQPCLTEKEQQLERHHDGGPWIVEGDPVRLAQVFRNLLDNACKYTPARGRIRIGLRDKGSLVEVTVADNGIGLPPASLDSVFGLFMQEARGVPHSSGGLGIGLAVVRQLIDAHGGRIEAHSAGVDLGSEFVFTLCRAAAGADPDPATRSRPC